MGFIASIIQLISLALIVWIVLSYIVAFGRLPYDHPLTKVYLFLSRLVDPMLKPIRAVLPPVRLGGTALDLSPLVLIVGLQILATVLAR